MYESDGRKLLEHNLNSLGASVQANLQKCDREVQQSNWRPFESDERAELFASEDDSFELRVTPVQDTGFNCYYHFTSAQEMFERAPATIDHTLLELQTSTPKTSREP